MDPPASPASINSDNLHHPIANSDPPKAATNTAEIQSDEMINPENAADDAEGEQEGEEEEEAGECGFCLFMKGGGCKDIFTEWEKCIDSKTEDAVESCSGVTLALTKCMLAHSDYYAPVLRVEANVLKKLQEEELEEESKGGEDSGNGENGRDSDK